MCKGWISFTVEALHQTDDVFFSFLQTEFNFLEVDHSKLESLNVVRLLLEDTKSKWFIPTLDGSIYEYSMEVEVVEDVPNFKITLLNETKTDSN